MKKISLFIALWMIFSIANAQSVNDIVKKHIEKTGSLKVYKGINSIKMKGRLIVPGQTVNIVDISTGKGKIYSAVTQEGYTVVQMAYDGKTAWHSDEMTDEPKEFGEYGKTKTLNISKSFPSLFINHKQKGYKIELAGSEEYNGEDCFKLTITPPSEEPYISYISKKTYHEVGIIKNEVQFGRKIKVSLIMENFKKVNGIVKPHKFIQKAMGESLTIIVDSYEINGKIDESVFSMK